MPAFARLRGALPAALGRVLPGALLLLLSHGLPAPGVAQGAPEAQQAHQGPIEVDPATGRRYREVRPDAPLRRGAYRVPRWVPVAAGAAVTLIALLVLGAAHRRRHRK